MVWNEKYECMSREEMKKLQSERLVKLVKYVYDMVDGVRTTTDIKTGGPIALYAHLMYITDDLRAESFDDGTVNLNPYIPTETVYIENCPGIKWLYPRLSPMFDQMQVCVDGRFINWKDE